MTNEFANPVVGWVVTAVGGVIMSLLGILWRTSQAKITSLSKRIQAMEQACHAHHTEEIESRSSLVTSDELRQQISDLRQYFADSIPLMIENGVLKLEVRLKQQEAQ